MFKRIRNFFSRVKALFQSEKSPSSTPDTPTTTTTTTTPPRHPLRHGRGVNAKKFLRISPSQLLTLPDKVQLEVRAKQEAYWAAHGQNQPAIQWDPVVTDEPREPQVNEPRELQHEPCSEPQANEPCNEPCNVCKQLVVWQPSRWTPPPTLPMQIPLSFLYQPPCGLPIKPPCRALIVWQPPLNCQALIKPPCRALIVWQPPRRLEWLPQSELCLAMMKAPLIQLPFLYKPLQERAPCMAVIPWQPPLWLHFATQT